MLLSGKSIHSINRVDRWLYPLTRTASALVANLIAGRPLNTVRRSCGLPSVDFQRWFVGKLILVNSAFGLEYQRQLPPSIQMVGPLLPEDLPTLPLDYDSWEAQGAPGWGYHDVLPYFIRSEDNARGASEFHGAGGPLRVSEQRSPRPLDTLLLQASAAAGIPRIADYNGPEQDGVSMFQVTQRNGARVSAADAFLRPALKRPNLEVRTRTSVLGIELEGDRAVGVRLRKGRSGEGLVRATGEVVLSAGAINSPQLLLLSGIGPAQELRAAGVEPRVDLPGVGRNLQDHPFVTVIWEVSDRRTLYGADSPRHLA